MLFRYLAARWKYRGPAQKRFLHSGLALERRAGHLSVFWASHLSRARAAQAHWAQTSLNNNSPTGTLTVLGAGPLYDFNPVPLAKCFNRFRLVDANPLAAASWTRLNTPVEAVITDITNCFAQWALSVETCPGSWTKTLQLIRDLPSVAAFSMRTDGLLSLNILSQLEVGWQELLEASLTRRFGARFVHKREQEWLNAIRPSSQKLVERHLQALEASNAPHILLISDAEYVDYTGRTYHVTRVEPPPVFWSEGSGSPGVWTADTGVEFQVTPALEGLELSAATLANWLPSYTIDWCENWLWHIAPLGTETAKHGKLHRVSAFALRYRGSVSA